MTRRLVLAIAAVVSVSPARAQIVVTTPRFTVGPSISGNVNSLDVAPTADGGMLFLWSEDDGASNRGYAYTRAYSRTGTALAPTVRADQRGHVHHASLSPDGDDGFVVGYWDGVAPYSLWGRYLDPTGAGTSDEFEADCEPTSSVGLLPSFAGLPSGMVAIYESGGARGCVRDRFGVQRTALVLGDGGFLSAVAALPGTGFVALWIDATANTSVGRLFDPNGVPLGVAFAVTPGAAVRRVAANPLGGFAVASVSHDGAKHASAVHVERFDATGTSLGAPLAVKPLEGGVFVEPDLAFDLSGDLYVVWSEHTENGAVAYRPAQARLLDPNGGPLGPAFAITDGPAASLRTARLGDGTFVNLWLDVTAQAAAADVISLCNPGTAVCGDGTLVPTCEQCDDGPANSDASADACRTNCTRARCGDGVVDAAESCDDGNQLSCDGCSKRCQLETGLTCGDGSVAPVGCGEGCDDGNTVAGDGCSDTCRLERIPGGGSPRTDCFSEWVMDNPVNLPFLDKHGAVNAEQRCIDDDDGCDFDGGAAGSCTFHVRVCGDNTERQACAAPVRLASWDLTQPSPARAAKSPTLAAVRSAFATLPGTLVGPSDRDLCSDVIAVTVPLRSSSNQPVAGKLVLKSSARSYTGARDKDALKLTCLPRP